MANAELLVDPRLARADLEAPETVPRDAAGGVIPKLCIGMAKRWLARIACTRSPGVVSRNANVNACAQLRRETRHEALQFASYGHGPTHSVV